MSIVENIRSLCARDGITINKLEKELGLGRGNIARWDTNAPAYDKLMKVAEYFNVTMEELVCSPLGVALNRVMRAMPGYVDPMEELEKHAHYALPVDDELVPYLEILRDRPDLRALLEASSKNTPEDVERMTDLASRLRGDPFAD